MQEEVDKLKSIHYQCRKFLDNKKYDQLIKYIKLLHEEADINVLKTILIITQSFKEYLALKNIIEETQILFDEKMKEHGH